MERRKQGKENETRERTTELGFPLHDLGGRMGSGTIRDRAAAPHETRK
jgi:hypothetical protein